MDTQSFLESIQSARFYHGQIAHVERVPAREAVLRDVDPPVSGGIGEALKRQGIERFYSHQADSIEAVRRGEHIVVVTATASGKTLCYNVPVIEALQRDPKARALYIYPTKALAQDQLGKIRAYDPPQSPLEGGGWRGVKAATYDGDTPRQERPFIKASANLILTNPDMLHVGILPYHTTWSDLFRNLQYVVIDEVHTYRGVFGAHVANIIRRLRRIAEYYGSHPTFICASATVKDPGKLVTDLTGIEPRVISNDGSPAGEKTFVFWNPPRVGKMGERRSSNSEAVELFTSLVSRDIRTLVFTKARKTAELILRYARNELKGSESGIADKIMSYRAGYRPAERREIERRLFSGELLGVTSTTALEVGVDIGGLDAVVMTGYPGTVASTWQQAGRSGRGVDESLAVLIALDDPIDQYLMRDPGFFFGAEHEKAVVDYQNPYILADHLVCAAYELPIENEEVEQLWGDRAWDVLAALEEVEQVGYRRRWFWTGADYPAKKVNIRSASGESYMIVSVERGGMLLGTVDAASAFETIHPGAVYLHAGEAYIVTRLDLAERTAYVQRTDVSYYTTPGSRTSVAVDERVESRELVCHSCHSELAKNLPRDSSQAQNDSSRVGVEFGDVTVANRVTQYYRKQLFTEKVLDRVLLDLPETRLSTESVWIVLPEELTNKLIGRGFDLTGTIHAIEHVTIGILPLFAICDRWDVGGVSHPSHPDTQGRAAIFIYDGYPGGVGIARTAYDSIDKLLESALKTLEDCGCDDGCPGCIQSPKCGNNNEPLDKAGAIFALRELLSSD